MKRKIIKPYLDYLREYQYEIADDFGYDERYYSGNDLGVCYSPEVTRFRVWSPTANSISLHILENELSEEPDISIEFERDVNGTWMAEVKGDMVNKYFVYLVKVHGRVNRVIDPYTRGLGTNSRYGMIVDLERTNPQGWNYDQRIQLSRPQDAVIYELHVRDFSQSPASGMENKGKYLAFTELDTRGLQGLKTGVAHLKELGITHVHLQPVFDFATVDDNDHQGYNWGYDPYFFNVPEGSYATNSSDDSRIREFKKMVKSLHNNNIGVIMDVVYNHTYATEDSPFNQLVPGYYYRFDGCGYYSNGSGTGNEVASEKPMVRKFIVDSVKYWAEEYHIDGFRFDLMALHDRDTMKEVENTLHKIDPSILIYGEPWTGGLSPLAPEQQMYKGAQQGMNIAVFNDHLRNAIKGDNDGMGTGFVSGAHHQELGIKRGVVGAIHYSNEIQDFADEPWETVNYVSSHDNLTLWDKLNKSNHYDSEEIKIYMDKMAHAIVFTSQGIPFIQGGEEFLRTKWGNHNSYNAGDQINQLKWERKEKYYNVFQYYRGLISLRKNHPAFRLKNAQEVREKLSFIATPYNTVGFLLGEYAGGDEWKYICVFYNPNREVHEFKLPFSKEWFIVINRDNAGLEILGVINSDIVTVLPISVMVLYSD